MIPIPSHWPEITADQPIGACAQCIYSELTDDAELHCTCYQVAMMAPTTCRKARSVCGACGPEARFLIVKGE